jgi:hypothetical protein
MAESYRRESHCQADFRKNPTASHSLIVIPNKRSLRREESARAAKIAFFAIRGPLVELHHYRLISHLDTTAADR